MALSVHRDYTNRIRERFEYFMSTSADSEGLEEPLVSQGRGYREFDTKLKEEAVLPIHFSFREV